MNKKAKLGLAVLAGLGVLGVAVTASADSGAAPRQRRPIGRTGDNPPLDDLAGYDAVSPGFVPSDATSPTQASAATNANAALDNLATVLQGAAPAVVQAAADALKTGTIPAGLPAPIADAVVQAGQAAATNDAAAASGPAATAPTQTQAAADLATQIQQAAPAVQQAAAAAVEALATGQALPPEVVAAAAPILQATAAAAQAAGVTAPSPSAASVEQPTTIPDDTALVLEIMLADEARANWKRKVPELIPWQRDRQLVADGMFGPKSALVMAEETGLVPIVRYWPTGSYKEGKWLKDYRAALLTEAATAEEPRASQLRAAANREQGQAFAPVQPITTLIALG